MRSSLCLAPLLTLTLVARAQPADVGLPKYNTEAACRALNAVPEARVSESTGPDATKHCVEEENEAREKLEKEWSQFKMSDRAMCVGVSKSSQIAPVYTELATCLEMARGNSGTETSKSSPP